MLVLTRKIGEGITIGDQIHVVVVEIKDGQVRLGIKAPRTVRVDRDEVHSRILHENREASSVRTIPLEQLRRLGRQEDGRS